MRQVIKRFLRAKQNSSNKAKEILVKTEAGITEKTLHQNHFNRDKQNNLRVLFKK